MNHKQRELLVSSIIGLIIFVGFTYLFLKAGKPLPSYLFLYLIGLSFFMGLSFYYFYRRKVEFEKSSMIVVVGTPIGLLLRPVFSWFWLIVKSVILFPIIGFYRIIVLIFGK